MADETRDEIRPVVVCGPDGKPLNVLDENPKGYRKTIERGELWAIHRETGRLLPVYEGIPATVNDRGTWYEARLERVPDAPTTTPADAERLPGGRGGAGEALVDTDPKDASGAGSIGEVLTALAALIAERHRTLPEGSYTTHLFESGSAKIRKKAGEEAIELVLAATRDELISESSDFIYHLLVLLENEGISLADLAAELTSR